jgi:uncharacterized protein with HEPN domain
VSRKRYKLDPLLNRILESINRIARFTNGCEFRDFEADQALQDAVLMNLIRIGEAFHQIELHFRTYADDHPELPIEEAYRLRNRLSHDYTNISLPFVWRTVQRELPEIRQEILRARGDQRSGGGAR